MEQSKSDKQVYAERIELLVGVLIQTINDLQQELPAPRIGGVLLEQIQSEIAGRLYFLSQ